MNLIYFQQFILIATSPRINAKFVMLRSSGDCLGIDIVEAH
jgi:hypothetical protein